MTYDHIYDHLCSCDDDVSYERGLTYDLDHMMMMFCWEGLTGEHGGELFINDQ